jgi:hypothetical protein
MKIYCIECGAPTEYSLKKPLFCSNCGSPFQKNAQNSQTIVKREGYQKPAIAKKSYKSDIEDDSDFDDYDDESLSVPEISEIQVETQAESPTRGVKLRDLMGTSENQKSNKIKIKSKRPSKKQTLEDFAREAGSLRKNKK